MGERVWNAEEKKRLEEEKTAELQKELQEEARREELERLAVESGLKKKKQDRLDWMYQGNLQSNTEEYLLGKRVDANVEVMKEEPETLASVSAASATIVKAPVINAKEVMLKMKEDPLFFIKKREEENRQELQANPI